MQKPLKNKFYCFSPFVMLMTFLIEAFLFLYVIARYKISKNSSLVLALLFCLASFQLAEYGVCEGFWLSSEVWAKFGYSAITLLPPLGLHLSYSIAKKSQPLLLGLAYLSALTIIGFVLFNDSLILGTVCEGNYVIFRLARPASWIYGAYYYFWLVAGITASLYFTNSKHKKMRQALLLQAVGYISFIVPTFIVNTLAPSTTAGIPSIMCGFALLYSLILVFAILPRVSTSK